MIIKYSDLKLQQNEATSTVHFNTLTFDVFQYLPISRKKDVIDITLHNSYVNGVFNDVLLEKNLTLNIIYAYTTIDFSDEDRQDEDSIYDNFVSTGLFNTILAAIPQEELDMLDSMMDDCLEANKEYNYSIFGVIEAIVNTLPTYVETITSLAEKMKDGEDVTVDDVVQAMSSVE